MLVSHLVSIIPEFIKAVVSHLIIADVYARLELRKVDIDPIRIRRLRLKKAGILDDPGINRIFKGIGVPGAVEQLVLMGRKAYPEITPGSGSIDAIAGQ
jgi:hypothetical protein